MFGNNKILGHGYLLLVLGVVNLVQAQNSETLCGVKEDDKSKTCISIRLPWQEAPIYFCTEKANIKFSPENRCTDRLSRLCPQDSFENGTLLVATPWDCCPLSSTPDICAGHTCPPAPYNRTCTEIPPGKLRPWDCCSTLICEEGVDNSNPTASANCQMKRLEPGCMTAPKDKKGCVAFKDDFGCCYKYQCEGEGKPGMCPMEVEAMEFKEMMGNKNNKTGLTTITTTPPPPRFGEDPNNNGTVHGGNVRSRHDLMMMMSDLKCIGDYNCPGEMKCCSPLMTTYYEGAEKLWSFNEWGFPHEKAVHGKCVKPVVLN